MPAIYPSTALKNQQREIKAIADKEVVHITENGWGKYVFMSEEVFEREIDDAVQAALYERRVAEAIEQGRKDFAEGKYYTYTSREDLMTRVAKMREELHAEA